MYLATMTDGVLKIASADRGQLHHPGVENRHQRRRRYPRFPCVQGSEEAFKTLLVLQITVREHQPGVKVGPLGDGGESADILVDGTMS